jgi:molecular chaperone GrpE
MNSGETEPEPESPAAADTAPAEGGGSAAEVDPVRLEIARLEKSYDESQARLREVSKAYNELKAEMAAFKDRMEARAKYDAESRAYDQVKAFFDPVMNLKRSIASLPAGEDDPLFRGLNIVFGQFMEALSRLGLSEVPGVGAMFDPRVHEALGTTPVEDPAQDGRVVAVLTTGFVVNGRVLQPAQVAVGKKVEPAGEA